MNESSLKEQFIQLLSCGSICWDTLHQGHDCMHVEVPPELYDFLCRKQNHSVLKPLKLEFIRQPTDMLTDKERKELYEMLDLPCPDMINLQEL